MMRNFEPGGALFAQRAVAAPLFADDEQQARAPLARRPHALDSRELRGQNPFRVADPRPQRVVVHRARKIGGTVSKCVDSTTIGSSSLAKTLKRPCATGCRVTR